MDRGDPEAAQPRHQRLAGIIGVNRAQLRLHGSTFVELVLIMLLIEVTCQPDHGACIDQTGRDDLGLDDGESLRDRCAGGGADGDDLAVVNHHHPVGDGGAGHGVDLVALDSDVLRVGRSAERECAGGGKAISGDTHQCCPSASASSQW